MTHKKINGPTFEEFRAAYPRKYAELCEKTGRIDEAMNYYSNSNDPCEIFHAAEIALKTDRLSLAKTLLEKTQTLNELMMKEAEARADESRNQEYGGLGEAFSYVAALESYEHLKSRISKMQSDFKKSQ